MCDGLSLRFTSNCTSLYTRLWTSHDISEMENLTWGSLPVPLLHTPSHIPTLTRDTTYPLSPRLPPASLAMFARARAMEGGTLMALSQMAATRQATWRSATKGVHTRSRTHTHSISHSHFLSLMNSYELFITHTCTRTHAYVSCREHTQLLSATEGSATSLYFIIISLGIFLGCKGIPGGARPLKLSTPPPPSSLPFPPLRTLSRALLSVWVLVISPQLSFPPLFPHCRSPLSCTDFLSSPSTNRGSSDGLKRISME